MCLKNLPIKVTIRGKVVAIVSAPGTTIPFKKGPPIKASPVEEDDVEIELEDSHSGRFCKEHGAEIGLCKYGCTK